MTQVAVIVSILLSYNLVKSEDNGSSAKPYVIFPVPLELPNRNERSEQCWLRIEDFDLIETFSVYCFIANEFLRSYIRDNNNKKMEDDDVNVNFWYEEPKEVIIEVPTPTYDKAIKDWKVTTILDPITRKRLYVSKKANCKLIMYSREGMSNYNIDCERLLYYFNNRPNSASSSGAFQIASLYIVLLFYALY